MKHLREPAELLRCLDCPYTVRKTRTQRTCCGKVPLTLSGNTSRRKLRSGDAHPDQRPSFSGLVVDDDGAVRDFVAAVLDDAGYSVVTAKNGPEALRLARASDALDFLVTDYEIGATNGLEIASLIRKIFPAIRVVLISGRLPEPSAAFRIVDAFIAKPFHEPKLCGALESVLKTRLDRTGHPSDLHN